MEDITKFWEEVSKLLVNPQHEIFYRLYHDDHGNMLFYSMEDLPGNYIEIDVEDFRSNDVNVKVRNGAVVVTTKENCKWNLKNYESDD